MFPSRLGYVRNNITTVLYPIKYYNTTYAIIEPTSFYIQLVLSIDEITNTILYLNENTARLFV